LSVEEEESGSCKSLSVEEEESGSCKSLSVEEGRVRVMSYSHVSNVLRIQRICHSLGIIMQSRK